MASYPFEMPVALYCAGGEMVWLFVKSNHHRTDGPRRRGVRAGGVYKQMIPVEVVHEGILSRVVHRGSPVEFVAFSLVGSTLEFFAAPALAGHLVPGRRVYAACLPTPEGGRAVIDLLHCDPGGSISHADKAALIRRREQADPPRAWSNPRRN